MCGRMWQWVNFIISLPNSAGKIVVIVGRLTKYAHFCMCTLTFYPMSIAKVALTFATKVCKLHGTLRFIVNDS